LESPKNPFKSFFCLITEEGKPKYDVLQMVIAPNKNPQWHAVKVAPICGVEYDRISKISIVSSAASMTPENILHSAI
jgi:hypothetical protein